MRLKQLHFILFFLLLLFSTVSYGQKYVLCRPLPAGGGSGSGSTPPSSNMNIQMGPPMNPAATSGCGAVNMTAIPVFNLGSSGGGGISMFGTTRYGVDTIAYKWDTISSNAMSIASGHWSNAIPIGFRFCTFGHSVDSFLISKTGAISFNLSLRNDTVLNSIPSATHALPSSNYAASGIFTTSSNVAVNLLNTYTKVRIRNLGTYPCSKLLISFDSIPVLDTACSLRFMHSQIVLYESNLIDIHLKQAPVCNTNTLLLIGLQNDLRDSAFSVPNYNLGNQSIINQAWRFFPNVVDSLKFRVKLYKNRVLVSTTIYPATTGSTFSPTIPYIMSGPTPTYDTLHCTLEIFHTAQFCQNSGGGMSVGPVDAVYFKDNSSSPTNPPPPSAACAKTYAGTVVYIGGCSGVGPIIAGSGYQNSTNLTNVDFQGTNGIGNVPGLIANVSSTIVAPFTVSAVQYFLVINPAGCVFQTGFNYTMDWYEIDTLKAQSIQAATCANNGIGTITLQKPDVLFGQILPLTHSNSTIQSNWSLCIPTPPGLTQVSQYVFKGPPGTYTFEVSDVYSPSWFNNCNSGLSPCNNNACKACAEYLTVVIPNQTYTIYKQNATQYICPGSAYQINGHSYTATGSYFDTLVNIYGCDSIIQTNVVLSQTYQYNRNVNICQGQTYTDGPNSFTAAGNYTLHYYTKYGCDSIINLTVNVNPVYTKISYDTICDNMAVFSGTHMYNQTGVYRDTLKTKYGCDSIFVEYLTVRNRSFTNIVQSICQGDSFVVAGKIYTKTGNYHDTLVNKFGCDSIIHTNLTVHPIYQYNRSVNICQGQTYTDGTSSFTTAGNYTLHYYTKYGCDSIINLTVKVNPVYTKISYDTICDNMAVFSGTHMYNQTGVYRDTLKTKYGCDSIFVEYLTVRNRSFTNIVQSICQGDSFVVAGKTYTKTGNYHDTLVNKFGCDSIIHTNLTVHPIYQYNRSVNICQGQTYTDGTSSFTTAGNYTLHYQTVHGCDSIINLNLVVYPSYSAVHYDTICDNQSLHVGNYVHNQTGIYADTLSTMYGCDSVIIEHLLVKARTFTNIVERRCEGDSVFISNKIYTVTGVYHDTLVNSVGCDSVIISNLYFEHPSVDLVALSDTVLGAGETFEFLVNTGYASDSIISLTPVKQIDSIENNKYSIRANGVVTINIVTETSLGCIASDSLTIREINIVLPTVFTPNGDNQNDIFIIRGGHAYELNRFFIVNRYGEIVFSTNDFSQGWDGTYQGVEQMVGTYQYVVEAHLRNSKKKFVLKGNLQLIR